MLFVLDWGKICPPHPFEEEQAVVSILSSKELISIQSKQRQEDQEKHRRDAEELQ